MKKRIDIEKLLQWALREEMPKGRPVSISAWDMIRQIGTLGVRVQTSGPVDGFGFVPGAPHEDAVIVAEAVRALPNAARLASEDDALALFGDLAAIAGQSVQALLGASFDARSIVIARAMMASRPPWEFDLPTPAAMRIEFMDATGALRDRPLVYGVDDAGDVVELSPHRGRKAQQIGLYDPDMSPRSPLNWCDPSPLSIAHARAEYFTWHSALTNLVDDLHDRLKEFDAVAPAAVARPWRTGQAKASRVLSDGVVMNVDPLPLVPKRDPAPRPYESKIERMAREHLAASRAVRRENRRNEGVSTNRYSGI